MHVLLVETAIEDFKISTSAINVLFMFHGKLNDEWFIFVGEWREFVREGIEASILGSLETYSKKNRKNAIRQKSLKENQRTARDRLLLISLL
jgi:hypothetical protein